MNNSRNPLFWKAAIMKLPDSAFFELLRTVFGKIKTPFNKQMLLDDLEKFLLRKDIQENIASFIDDNDARVIAAIAAMNEPAPGELEAFFAGELSYSELYDILINLEERFILYRFVTREQNRSVSHLALNPVLEPVLSPYMANKSLLFPSVSINDVPQDELLPPVFQFLFDDRILAALFSFVDQNKAFFRGSEGGAIRQKVVNAAKAIFPGLPLELVTGGLQILGLFFAKDEMLIPDNQRFTAFGHLSRPERLIYCAAGIWCYTDSLAGTAASRFGDSGSLSPYLLRSKARSYAEVICRLYSSLDSERLYPYATLQKMAHLPELSFDAKIDKSALLGMMEKIGLIVQASDKYWRKVSFEQTAQDNAAIAMDTPFTVLVYPEIAYNDVIALAVFADVTEAGMTVRFELSRESVVLAFNRGVSADTIVELLQRLSNNRINENLLFSLRDWEKQYGEVTLQRGLILTLSPEQRHLAETRLLSKLITETVAPGVYLLPETAEEKAAEALRKAGVTIIARNKGSEESFGEMRHTYFSPLNVDKPHSGNDPHASKGKDSAAAGLIEKFHSILGKTQYGKEERDELAARINRRLILCESQLKDAVVRYEKLEARSMDYLGKAMIAKQAISLQSPVEAFWPGKKNQQERIYGIPKALEKTESESILIIDSMDGGDTVRLSLGKISLLRRIKKSIFEA